MQNLTTWKHDKSLRLNDVNGLNCRTPHTKFPRTENIDTLFLKVLNVRILRQALLNSAQAVKLILDPRQILYKLWSRKEPILSHTDF